MLLARESYKRKGEQLQHFVQNLLLQSPNKIVPLLSAITNLPPRAKSRWQPGFAEGRAIYRIPT